MKKLLLITLFPALTMAGGLSVNDQVGRCMELLKEKNTVTCKIYTTAKDHTKVFDIEKIVLRKFGTEAIKSITHEGYQGKRIVLFKAGKKTKKAFLIETPRKAGRNNKRKE